MEFKALSKPLVKGVFTDTAAVAACSHRQPNLSGTDESVFGFGSAFRRLFTKTLLVMRLTLLLLTAAALQVSAKSAAQTVTYSGKDVPLEKVFSIVEQQTGYVVFFDYSLLQGSRSVSISVKDVPLESFLSQILQGQQLDYSIKKKTIFIKKITSATSFDGRMNSLGMDELNIPLSPLPIRGQIIDQGGKPLRDVNIVVKGTNKGTSTDHNGRFNIDAKVGDVLVVSSIGYLGISVKIIQTTGKDATAVIVSTERQQRPSNADDDISSIANSSLSSLTIKLAPDVSSLNEVVINKGYYTEKQKYSAGNVAHVGAKDIEKQPITSPLLALQGRMAGVEISPNSGLPGNAINIKIRGQNSLRTSSTTLAVSGNLPLYIIDGVPVDSRPVASTNLSTYAGKGLDPLSAINAADIVSIEVLKDADATAIYGSRGANGVVLITTKSAKTGQATNFEANIYKGVGEVTNYLPLLKTEQYLEMRNEAFRNDNAVPGGFIFPDHDIKTWDTTRYTDIQKSLIGHTAQYTNAQAALTGGNGKTSFRLSGGLHSETPVFPGEFRYRKINTGLDIQHVSTNTRFTTNLSVLYGSEKNKTFNTHDFLTAFTLPPDIPALYDDEGKLNWENSTFNNPMAALQRTQRTQISNLIANAVFAYRFGQNFTFKLNAGFTDYRNDDISITPLSSYDPLFVELYGYTGAIAQMQNSRQSYLIEPQLQFKHSINHHQLDFLVGSTFNQSRSTLLHLEGSGITSDGLVDNIQAAPIKGIAANQVLNYKYLAAFGRINYNYQDKYILNLTARRDGSSRFGPNNLYANFGAVGAAWIFSEENFLNNNNFLNFGKLRASYGITGNDQIGDYQYNNSFTLGNVVYQGYTVLSPSRLYNPDFQWETTRKLEAAIELGFANNSVNVELSWYRNRSSNQLVGYSLPLTTGFTSVNSNLDALIQNSGWEIVMAATPVSNQRFKWNFSINFTAAENKLVKFDDIENSTYAAVYSVGQPLSIEKYYIYKGVNPSTGLYEFEDLNKDNIIDIRDREGIIDYTPDFYGGLNNSFSFAGFDLSFLCQFSKKDVFNYSNSSSPGFNVNQTVDVLNRWQKDGDVRPVQRFSQDFFRLNSNALQQHSLYLLSTARRADGSFIRFKTLSLSYDLTRHLRSAEWVKQASIYMQGQNLFTARLGDFTGFDPEVISGIPPLRIVSLGIQLKF